MSAPSPWIRNTFYAASAVNWYIVVISDGFTNQLLGQVDPLFAPMGCMTVCLWGLAYAALANQYHRAPTVSLVFAIEKFFYVGAWLATMRERGGDYTDLYAADASVGSFYNGYGIVDGAFGIFFAYVWFRHRGGAD